MSDTIQPLLDEALEAIQQGQTDKAQRILVDLLEENSQDAETWFLLSATVDNHRTTAHCLRNALAIDPEHDGARQMMAKLAQQVGIGALTVMRVGANSAAMGKHCPYCSGPFRVREEVVFCPACNVSHHFECWAENNHACAGTLCEGFSLEEIYSSLLPMQPPAAVPQPIVIRKEDIPERGKVSRKEQEQSFQRRLLLMALLAEEGELTPGLAGALPSVDEILDQVQRDRVVQGSTVGQADRGRSSTSAAPPGPHPDDTPRIITGSMPIWPQQIARSDDSDRPYVASCRNCGRIFEHRKPNFCSQCGTRQ